MLVPFLVFAIGMSHGAQKMNGIMQDIGRGTHRVVAARYTFRRLFVAGLTALLCDAVGFAVLTMIHIQVIQDLAVVASIGVAVLIFTNLVLLPILLSLRRRQPEGGRAQPAAGGCGRRRGSGQRAAAWLWRSSTTSRGAARRWRPSPSASLLAVGGYAISLKLQIGDLDPGAPELRADSRYNRDNDFMARHYAASTDILVVMVATPEDQCTRYGTLAKVDRLAWRLEQLPGRGGDQLDGRAVQAGDGRLQRRQPEVVRADPERQRARRRADPRAARAVQPGLLVPVAVRLPEGPQGRRR